MRHFYCWGIFHMIQWSQGDWHPWEGPGFWVLGSTQRANCSGDWLWYLYIVRQQWLWVCQEVHGESIPKLNISWFENTIRPSHPNRKIGGTMTMLRNDFQFRSWWHVSIFKLKHEFLMFNACPPLLVSCCPYHLTIYSWSNPPKPVDLEKKVTTIVIITPVSPRRHLAILCRGWVEWGPFIKACVFQSCWDIYSSTPKWSSR